MKRNGTQATTLYSLYNQLKHIARYSDLHDPEKVKDFIADKKVNEVTKQRLCVSYNSFCLYYKIEWKMPNYDGKTKQMPKLPTEEQINTLITGAGKCLSLRLRVSKETGLRPIELCNLKASDLDIQHSAILPSTAKHGSPRILKISLQLAQDLNTRIITNNLKPNDKLFGASTARHYGTHYREMRKALAKKLNRPDLLSVRLYDFRHFFGTMQYMKLRDIPLTANDMGHRDYNTTSKYLHLARIAELATDEQWICKAVTTKDEAKPLIESGFQYVNTTPDGFMLYRKRK
jgi:integrase